LVDEKNITCGKQKLEYLLKPFSLKQFLKDMISCCSKKKMKIVMKFEMFLKKFYSKLRGIWNKRYLREEKKKLHPPNVLKFFCRIDRRNLRCWQV
jgi:hypothetical protein